MGKVVDAQPAQAGRPDRQPPHASPECGHPKRATLRGGEHEVLRVAWSGWVGGQLVGDEAGQPDRAPASAAPSPSLYGASSLAFKRGVRVRC
jgi:hypothetical protein